MAHRHPPKGQGWAGSQPVNLNLLNLYLDTSIKKSGPLRRPELIGRNPLAETN
jgi:hypothetical protein